MKFVYAFVLIVLVFGLIHIANVASSEGSSLSLALPSSTSNYQSDKFRDGNLDCSNAIGSATNLEFGVTGLVDKNPQQYVGSKKRDVNVGVFARITIPLGKRAKARIDCNRLYELALREKMLEVRRLEYELKTLQALQFEK